MPEPGPRVSPETPPPHLFVPLPLENPGPAAGAAPSLPADVVAHARADDRLHAVEARARAEELAADGRISTVAPHKAGGTPEFGRSTDVYYVNGINTSQRQQGDDAQLYADRIHRDVRTIHVATDGISADLAKCALEQISRQAAAQLAPEQSVMAVLREHLHGAPGAERFEGDVHFAAHSRGALVVQRGIEGFHDELRAKGWSEERIASTLTGHLSVETFGGASTTTEPYVAAVHYVNTHDGVASSVGASGQSLHTTAEIAQIAERSPALAGELEAFQIARMVTNQPNGPVVMTKGHDGANPVDDLLSGHNVEAYIAGRSNFPKTVAEWQASHREPAGVPAPHPTSGHAPDASEVQRQLDRLREQRGVGLPDVRELRDFNGRAQNGSFVHVSPDYVAQHCGRGTYEVCHVGRDLDGVVPPEGQPLDRGSHGQMPFQQHQSLGQGR